MHDAYKSVQIPRELFQDLVRYHLMELQDEETELRIREALQSKLARAAAREEYWKSRTNHSVV